MTDGNLLSDKAVEQIAKMNREHTRRMMNLPQQRGRWQWHGGGGGGSITIRFRIVAAEAYCMDCYATARIISGPPEVTDPDSLPGTTYNYEAQYYTIRVYDMGEGWLNHPPEDLLNMIGHATWLRSYEDGPCAEVPGLHWEIISLQDPENVVCE